MIGVDIFSGVGGMSLGASMAGVNVKFAVEIDKYAAETFMANHEDVTMLNDDVQNLHKIPLNKRYHYTFRRSTMPRFFLF
jgi:DNA (cytosine-5)-methyltransferase 1